MTRISQFRVALALPSLFMLWSCQAQPELDGRLLYVDKQLVDCDGVAPRTCLRVKKTADADWEFFYAAIEGFKHMAGCAYTLRVDVNEIANPPADASSLRYSLIEEVSRNCN